MTRDEIYNHLAQVYLGKRNSKNKNTKKQFSVWLFINILITGVIFLSAFYGLTAFLEQKTHSLQSSVIYALNNGPIRVIYNLNEPFPPVESFSISIPEVNFEKYSKLNFSIRGLEEGYPGIVKVEVRNKKSEVSTYFVNNVNLEWQKFSIPIDEFEDITDWTNLTEVLFIFEAWNVEKKKGIVLIEDISFSS